MLRHKLLCILALACAILVLGSLTLLANPARAQLLSGQASRALSPAQQAMKSDLGPGGPFNEREWDRAQSKLTAPTGPGNPAGSSKQPPVSSCWSVVSSPNPSADFNQLLGTSALSPRDVWAVGWDDNGAGGSLQTLIEHWNGSAWTVVPSPNVGLSDNVLAGVAGTTSRDVWAVGDYYDGTHNQTLIEHWNGTVWSVVSSPNPGNANNYLSGVTAVSSRDVWAVGTDHVDGVYGPSLVTLVEHWNGTAWSAVPSPNPYPGSARALLNGVTNVSQDDEREGRDDLWAVGSACSSYHDCGNGVIAPQTLIEHWNGSAWTIVNSPNHGTTQNQLGSVSGTSAHDVWAVGGYCTTSDCSVNQSMIQHWNGEAWSIVPSPNPGSVFTGLFGVIALTPRDAWAVGSYSNDGNTFANPVLHWNGSTWTAVTVTNPGALDNDLRSLTAIGRNDVWAVGDFDNGSGEQTQVQQFDGPCH